MSKLPLIAGNWKMNGLMPHLLIADSIAATPHADFCKIALFPSFTQLSEIAKRTKPFSISVGAQDCHHKENGAFTGEVCAQQIKDCGADMVILGHSERRHNIENPLMSETCALISDKVIAATSAGLVPIICIGETMAQREALMTGHILETQLSESLPDSLLNKSFHISYEPVWAIGTGLVASDKDIEDALKVISAHLLRRFGKDHGAQILYGGSVKPDNARHILGLNGVGGLLVGGASLSVETFVPIILAAKTD